MKKYDAQKFDKHFVNWGRMPGGTPISRHYLAIMACFVFAVVTLVILLFSTSLYLAGITALAAFASYFFYGKWKKELEAEMGSKLRI